MTLRFFCDRCDRDISDEDRFSVRVDTHHNSKLKAIAAEYCVRCAEIVMPEIVEEAKK
jgi:hypothetical protein